MGNPGSVVIPFQWEWAPESLAKWGRAGTQAFVSWAERPVLRALFPGEGLEAQRGEAALG